MPRQRIVVLISVLLGAFPSALPAQEAPSAGTAATGAPRPAPIPLPTAPGAPAPAPPSIPVDASLVFAPQPPPAASAFDRVHVRSLTPTLQATTAVYHRVDDVSEPYVIVSATRRSAGEFEKEGLVERIGGREVELSRMSSDGSDIGWQARWFEPDGTVVMLQVYDIDPGAVRAVVPTVQRVPATIARDMIDGSDSRYQYRMGPESQAKQVARGRPGSGPWTLTAFVPPRYPIATFERRHLCWQLRVSLTRSGSHCASQRLAITAPVPLTVQR